MGGVVFGVRPCLVHYGPAGLCEKDFSMFRLAHQCIDRQIEWFLRNSLAFCETLSAVLFGQHYTTVPLGRLACVAQLFCETATRSMDSIEDLEKMQTFACREMQCF